MASIGQLAATTPAEIVPTGGGGGKPRTLSLLFYNAHATDDQVVEVTLTRSGGTARTIFKDNLKPKEKLLVGNLQLEDADQLKAAATAATSVNYVVLPGAPGGLFGVESMDASGARKAATASVLTGDIALQDATKVRFGTGDDITMAWDGTNLNVLQAAPNSAIKWGIDGAGIDQILYGDTASANITWDQSADKLIFSGVAKLQLQTIAAATGTAIPVTHSGSFPITQNGAETNTLADPTFLGQTLTIFVDTDTSGARVITAASRINQAANTIITLTEVGDFIKLEAITIGGALKWQVVANDGAVLS